MGMFTVDLKGRARLRRHPFAIDVGLGFEEGLVVELDRLCQHKLELQAGVEGQTVGPL